MNKKVNWLVRQIQSNGKVKIENVVSVTLNNYSDDVVYFTNNNVKRPLPTYNSTDKLPVPFEISIFGYEFDLDIDFDFDGKSGNVVIDYATLKQC